MKFTLPHSFKRLKQIKKQKSTYLICLVFYPANLFFHSKLSKKVNSYLSSYRFCFAYFQIINQHEKSKNKDLTNYKVKTCFTYKKCKKIRLVYLLSFIKTFSRSLRYFSQLLFLSKDFLSF